MEPRHEQFISSLVAMSDDKTRPLVECALKEYIVIEGRWNFYGKRNPNETQESPDTRHAQFESAMDSISRIYPENRSLVDSIRAIYSVTESVDSGMKKLNSYLGKKPTEKITDKKGYVDTTKKAYNYFRDAHIQEGAWAVHFTNEDVYPKIKKDGFDRGTTVLDHLAYTTMYEGGRGKQGWLFALPVGCEYLKHYDLGYGDCAFLIKADGVIAKHVGEQDDELIFRDKDVIKKVPFRYNYDTKKWLVEPADGENKEFDTIGQVIEAYMN